MTLPEKLKPKTFNELKANIEDIFLSQVAKKFGNPDVIKAQRDLVMEQLESYETTLRARIKQTLDDIDDIENRWLDEAEPR